MSRDTITYRHFGGIERPCRSHGRASYFWAKGYVEITHEGHELHPPVTRLEAVRESKAPGKRATFTR